METPLFFLLNGTASVTLFFVLSGFVLSYGYFKNPERPIAGAVIRRWPRLFPIALASTVLSYALFKLDIYHYSAASEFTHSDWMSKFGYASQQFTSNVTFVDAVTQGAFFTFFRSSSDSWMNSSLWTMHLELLGSFIVFGLTAVIREGKPKEAPFIFLTTGVLVFFGNYFLPLFVVGTCLAYFHSKYKFIPKTPRLLRTVLIVSLVLLAFGYQDPAKGFYQIAGRFSPFESYFRICVHGLASVALIHFALLDRNLNGLLAWRPLCFLGHVSFPLYVLHVPLIFSVGAGVFVYFSSWQSYRISVLACFLATLSVLIPLSYFLSKFDQKWCSSLKDNIPN